MQSDFERRSSWNIQRLTTALTLASERLQATVNAIEQVVRRVPTHSRLSSLAQAQ